jgi:hypothetical protein
MVELAGLGVEIRDEVSEADAPRELGDHQSQELVPAADGAQFAATMMALSGCLEFMSRKEFEKLGEDGRMMSQGLVPPLFSVVWVAPPL